MGCSHEFNYECSFVIVVFFIQTLLKMFISGLLTMAKRRWKIFRIKV